MKVSLKLEDEQRQSQIQNPIVKAKIPITIFNQPFASTLCSTTSTPKDISFSLSTNFQSGPSLKLTYLPSSSTTTTTTTTAPLSLSLKSGLGLFGSPHNSPLVFTASFSLSTQNPTFSLHLKPQFGDFSLHRSTSSSSDSIPETNLESGSPSSSGFVNGFASVGKLDSWQELKLEPFSGGGGEDNNRFQNPKPGNSNGVDGRGSEAPLVLKSNQKGWFFPGVVVKARTLLPLTKRFKVNLRWGLNFKSDSEIKMPYLSLHKIGLERVEEVNKVDGGVLVKSDKNNAGDVELLKGMYFSMSHDLEVMAKENRELMQSLKEMKFAVRNSNEKSGVGGKKVLPPVRESSGGFEQWRSKKNAREENGQRDVKKNGKEANGQKELKKPVSDVEAELQRAIKAASS